MIIGFFTWIWCVNGNVDESGQICLLTLGENSSRRMRELRYGFLHKKFIFGC
jgi:hypothetical protein